MWMGLECTLGYVVKDSQVGGNPAMPRSPLGLRVIEIGSGTELARRMARRGVTTHRGHRIGQEVHLTDA